MPKSIGGKRRLVFESDEEEGEDQPRSKRAQVLEEYMNQTEPEPKPSTSTAAENRPATNRPTANTSTERPALLPTPTLPVYHLRLEDFDINDIVVNVS